MIQATHKAGVSNSLHPARGRDIQARTELLQEHRCEEALKRGEKFELIPVVSEDG